jgi:ADP-ribosylglycohydrolase
VNASQPTLRERIVGCLLGGAIGDALGAPVEFDSIGAIRNRYGHAGVTGYLPAYGRDGGAITDDTQMTLFTAEGLLRAFVRERKKGIATDVPELIRRSYLRWLVTQGLRPPTDFDPESAGSGWLIGVRGLHSPRAPGNTCLSALKAGGRGTVDRPVNDSKGCGAVMRVAPLGFVGKDAFRFGAEAGALTHSHPSGFLSAGALAAIIGGLFEGQRLLEAIDGARAQLRQWPRHEETLRAIDAAVSLAASDDEPTPELVESLGGGWVGQEALAIGVYGALVANDVRSGLLLAVNHGGDSDSTGAVAGNLLGTMYGVGALPDDLLGQLEIREVVERVANDLADAFVDGRTPDWNRYPGF